MEVCSVLLCKGCTPWRGLLLTASLLSCWYLSTTARFALESVPPEVIEGENAFFLVHNLPENLAAVVWSKRVKSMNHVIVTYALNKDLSVPGPLHSGRETVYRNGSLLLRNVTRKDTGLYTIELLDRLGDIVSTITAYLRVHIFLWTCGHHATSVQPSIESVPPSVAEGESVLLLVHNPPLNIIAFVWFKWVNSFRKLELVKYLVDRKATLWGSAYTGRETLYSDGSLLLHGVTHKDPGVYTVRFLRTDMRNAEAEVQLQVYGTHTLHYNLMALSLEGTRKSKFRAQGYIDNELFLHYEGYRRRAELWGPRIKGKGGAEIWTRETEDMQEKEEQLRRMLTEVMTQKGQHRGIHTLQATFGCETQGNNTGGFWRLGYNGQDYLIFDQKSQKWKVAVPSAYSSKIFWERHGPSVDQVQTFLNDICPDRLQRYSIYLGNQLMDTGSPNMTVTSKVHELGRITLTCWAFNLYTPMATLTWLRDGKPAQQHTFGPGTFLPSGDGTYQTWVSIWVLPGQEPHFTCRLRHRSKNIEVPTLLGPQARKTVEATSSASALVASAFPAMLVFLACA